MSYKKFSSEDLIYNVIKTHPEVVFRINNGRVEYQNERLKAGNFSNNVKHVASGFVSLHELNVNRPETELIYPHITKTSQRIGFRSVSVSSFDAHGLESNNIEYGQDYTGSYPLTASISRIFIPAGREIPLRGPAGELETVIENKKYIRSLRNTLEVQGPPGAENSYGGLGTKKVNIICVPGVFYGSKIQKGSIKLSTYIEGTLVGTAEDIYSDGRLIETYNEEYGGSSGDEVGMAIYSQGLMLLTSSATLKASNLENYESTSATTSSTWLNYGTGLPQIGTELSHGSVPNTLYVVDFKGTNKIPTLTMYAYSNLGEQNYSHNPTFLKEPRIGSVIKSSGSFYQKELGIKKVNKSSYSDHEESFINTTYISKIGIYDKYKNLIAIASLANPVKKLEKRDYMFKIGLDF